MKKMVFGKSRGQVMVMYAAATVGLVGVLALCADVGVMYVNWQQTQKVADAAALAGANYLSGSGFDFNPATGTVPSGCTGDGAQQAACMYAVDNGLLASNLNPYPSETASTITVTVQQTGLPYYFGKVLGLDNYTVKATAVAQMSLPPGSTPIFPVGLQCGPTSPPNCSPKSLVAGQPVHLGTKFAGVGASGNWQFLDVSGGSGGGDKLLEEAIEGTAPSTVFSAVTPGTGACPGPGQCTIQSEPGNKGQSGPITKAVSNLMTECSAFSSTYKSNPCSGSNPAGIINPKDPCLVTVPVVNFAGCTGNCSLSIEGFAQIYLESGTTSTSITGCYVGVGDPGGTGSKTALAFGPTVPPVLTQ
jgi:Putative Flp pilus-assembly TadE/G-like